MSTVEIFRELYRNVDLVASAIVKKTMPQADLISQRKAFKEYGAPFIRRGEECGALKPIRTGSTKTSTIKYSRTEILCYLEAEAMKRADAMSLINN